MMFRVGCCVSLLEPVVFFSVLLFVVVGDRRGVVCRLYALVLRERVVLPVLTGTRMVVSVFIGIG